MLKRLPIGIQSFNKLRDPENDFVYVDKTEAILRLVTAGEYFFLSRPRRFGKSVMLSTLYELFSGNRELFDGLYIENKWNWERKYPVIRISFGGGDFRTEETFDQQIQWNMDENRERLGLDFCSDVTPEIYFRELIKRSCELYKEKTVILIDEYDKPILDHMTDKKIARFNRDKLKGFYAIMKDLDEYVRFVMITGVSKFAKMNLFSGLNNLNDITIDADYSTLCGYTHAEVETFFSEHLVGVDMEKLKEWYNGYNYFGEPLYNPFDILLFLSKNKEFRPYWWGTGNPTFLVDLLKERPRYIPDLENYIADDIILDTFDVDHIDLVALLWQTGYLTFAEKFVKREKIVYRMKVPNLEIQLSLNELFIDYLTGLRHEKVVYQDSLYDNLEAGNMAEFRRNLAALFAAIPYHNYTNNTIQESEGYYASVVYAYLASLGLPLIPEETSSRGHVDLTILLPGKVYVIEFKVDQPGGRALEQVLDKGYHDKYVGGERKIYILGINFDSKKKNITEFEWTLKR